MAEATHITIEIALGNDASTDWDDVGWALDRVSKKIRNLWFERPNDGDMLSMVDSNGNTIGWLKAIRNADVEDVRDTDVEDIRKEDE